MQLLIRDNNMRKFLLLTAAICSIAAKEALSSDSDNIANANINIVKRQELIQHVDSMDPNDPSSSMYRPDSMDPNDPSSSMYVPKN